MDLQDGAEYTLKLDSCYAVCRRLARAHYENFPVASWLVPRAMRPHVAAVYAFARTADDFADEGDAPPALRLARLAAWRDLLHGRQPGMAMPVDAPAIFVAVHDTIGRFGLSPQLFDDLISAFEQDVSVNRYEAWDDLLDYCRRSANPVGRLVLALARCDDARALQQSDAVCTALQLTNFWQDFGRDWASGRLYVPRELLALHRARESDIGSGQPPAAWQAVFDDVCARTAVLFDAGRGVPDAVRGRLRYELRATWLGGVTILRRTAQLRRTSFEERPTLTSLDAARLARDAVLWR